MKLTLRAALLATALTMPATFATAQTQSPAANAEEHDAHHPAEQGTGATSPATGTATPVTPENPQAQIGMMMGDMRQMMGMMQQMMRMMGGGNAPGGGPARMMGGGITGGMPMMGMMSGQPGLGGPGMGMGPGPMAGGPGGPGGPGMGMGPGSMPGGPVGLGMFRHTEGILAFYKAELRITDAQAAPWNAFADAVRTHAKNLRDAMQRAATQRATATAPEQLDQRVALLSAQLDATKAVAAAGKALYAALSPEQRKLADAFMGDHLRGMRGLMP